MQTSFTRQQLADPDVRESDAILRKCVHCGFCLATCPTYVLLGDELDSPRGRIYLIKDMLENDRPASAKVALHIDRCLSCLACNTTCPSGVNYQHLVDMARARIARTHRRPWPERMLHAFLAATLPHPGRFRLAMRAAALARPFRRWLPGRLRQAAELAPARPAPASAALRPGVYPAKGVRRMRAALVTGCVQEVLAPRINAATVRLLTRRGVEVVVAEGAGCCGALVHHLGRDDDSRAAARANIAAWSRHIEDQGLDAVIANAAGCGTMIKDYGFVLREDEAWAARAARVSELACDVSEILRETGLAGVRAPEPLRVAYQSACSLRHGQAIHDLPRELLERAGFEVCEPAENHLCCGSAGTYNLLQPKLARELGERKAANLARAGADVVATGNIGCMTQIGRMSALPVVHTVELLDWATGGPRPPALEARRPPAQ